MSRPKLCTCGHTVGRHSHMAPHECKEDRCGCPEFSSLLPRMEKAT